MVITREIRDEIKICMKNAMLAMFEDDAFVSKMVSAVTESFMNI